MWKKYLFENNKIYYWKSGELEFWIKKSNKEWSIAHRKSLINDDSTIFFKEVDKPVDCQWNIFIGDKNNSITLSPSLPDRPVVIKPTHLFKLLPNSYIQIFVPLPLCIQFFAGMVKKENLMYEIPTTLLSSTWFGDPDNGTLSYSVGNVIYTSFDPINFNNNQIVCPVKIINENTVELDFQRLSLHVDNLSIYGNGDLLVTNETKVKFKGENSISDLHISGQPPAILPQNTKLMASPRNLEKSNVLKKSFYFIRSLTDY